MATADIGLIGLAVMGQNLALNIHDHGYRVAVHNRSPARLAEFLEGPAAGTGIVGAERLADLAAALERPRRILLMVKAGAPVDAMIEQLLPHLEVGDVIIDGGNSEFRDTTRRTRALAERGILFLGTGISGGEEGARHGPSIMPGGNAEAWPLVRGLLRSIAAQVDGIPCCDWVGPDGAGHYVKMVHNGIEYGDMQLIAEAAHLMRAGLGLDAARLAEVFGRWNTGPLESYLIEITAHIFAVREADGTPRVERILDVAGQKGTGRWTVASALELGVPLTLIGEAVLARFLSALKDSRVRAAGVLGRPSGSFGGDAEAFVAHIHDALYAAKIVSYAQGFMLMAAAAAEHGWKLDYGGVAMLWRGGCIIRSRFLHNIRDAFARDPGLESLMLDPFFAEALGAAEAGWRRAVGLGVELGVPVPALASALAFYDGYRSPELPANLLQAQRDYFGAHTYERTDRPRGQHFHTEWAGGVERPA